VLVPVEDPLLPIIEQLPDFHAQDQFLFEQIGAGPTQLVHLPFKVAGAAFPAHQPSQADFLLFQLRSRFHASNLRGLQQTANLQALLFRQGQARIAHQPRCNRGGTSLDLSGDGGHQNGEGDHLNSHAFLHGLF